MKASFMILIVGMICAVSVAAAEAPNIRVKDAYVRALPPGVQNTSAYMVIENPGDAELILSGARSTIAADVSLHETVMVEGQMSMIPISSLTIPAGGELVLQSGARHFMLTGLVEPLAEGEDIGMTLLFESGLEFQISLPARSVLSESAHSGH